MYVTGLTEGGEFTLSVTALEVVPPEPVHSRLYVNAPAFVMVSVVSELVPTLEEPEGLDSLHELAPVDVHDNLDVSPMLGFVLLAEKLTAGGCLTLTVALLEASWLPIKSKHLIV